MTKKTLVVGASLNPARYSHMAIQRLVQHQQPVLAYGLREGEVAGVPIHTDLSVFSDQEIDTVTLYVGPRNQAPLYDKILKLEPKRVIFNPGTENPSFEEKLKEAGVETLQACTLVMLSVGHY
jgi:predicted CoA-binding protein